MAYKLQTGKGGGPSTSVTGREWTEAEKPTVKEECVMDRSELRRTRLAQLLDLAQNYKGCTRKELARTLRRDPTKLVPGSGIPKLDLVVDLSGVLDWQVDDVVSYLWGTDQPEAGLTEPTDFEALDAAAREAHAAGNYDRMIEFARAAFEVAETAEEKARACNREAGGWDGVGRYANVLKAVQRGLQMHPVSSEFRRMLQVNLANAYYSLFSLVEARSIANDLLRTYEANPPETLRDRKTRAFAYYVSGHTYRRLMSHEPDRTAELAELSLKDLCEARDQFVRLAADSGIQYYEGIANTCAGGIVEAEVALERRDAIEALKDLCDGLDAVGDDSDGPVGDRLESYGWWCIFGCNIAMRSLTDEADLQHYMAILTNKADQIAERLDNWSIRERVFTMEHSRWERAVRSTRFDIPRVVDDEEVRVITGTMARFPTFHKTGWEILRSARVVRSS